MLNRRWILAVVPAALFVGAAALTVPVLAKATAKPMKAEGSLEGKPAPEVSLDTLDGKKFVLSEYKNNVVVLDFWATWCPPCRKSLPHVEEISKNADLMKKGLRVVAVNAQEDKPVITEFLKKNNYSFVVPMDKNGKAMGDYGVQGIPTTVVVGRDGTIKKVFVGFGEGSAKNLDDAIAAALDEK